MVGLGWLEVKVKGGVSGGLVVGLGGLVVGLDRLMVGEKGGVSIRVSIGV